MSAGQSVTSSVLIVKQEEVQAYSMMGRGEARLLVTGKESNGEWWLGHFREDPGFVTPLHRHPKTDEQFYVLEGVLSIFVDGGWQDLGPGTFAVVPKGVPHAQGNFGGSPVKFLGSGNPSGFENYFPALDGWAKRGLTFADAEFHSEMRAVAPACDIELLGPTPAR